MRMSDGKAKEERVSKRRVIPRDKIPGADHPSYVREEELVCPRCNHGNAMDQETCQQCSCPLQLSEELEKSIGGRLSRDGTGQVAVESTSDEGEVGGGGIIEELKAIPIFS